MSLKDFQIPVSILPELYKNTLIESGTNRAVPAKQKAESEPKKVGSIRFLGGNDKKIAIVVNEKEQSYLNDEDLLWLQKMLQACKLTLGDVAIVNLHPVKVSAAYIKDQLHSKKMILLGPTPEMLEMPLNFPPFKPQEHAGCVYLSAPAPGELNQVTEEGKLLKTKLWVSLQKIFEA